ncbi:MAG: hypothetical protein QOI60_605 [Actinomycetota bacterium]|jgi:hypothetical protein|nr:hypothetical protein [Actinomycetota bacterium]MEA2556833.1 hypothetical protein [Actinomycetota bacterium]MEA2580958.1 hypothetical protein [Actinomycetota bacterium]
MDFPQAALAVLEEERSPLHWTVIQDLALRRGHLDPFTQPDIRTHLLAALGQLAKDGRVAKLPKGVYALPDQA